MTKTNRKKNKNPNEITLDSLMKRLRSNQYGGIVLKSTYPHINYLSRDKAGIQYLILCLEKNVDSKNALAQKCNIELSKDIYYLSRHQDSYLLIEWLFTHCTFSQIEALYAGILPHLNYSFINGWYSKRVALSILSGHSIPHKMKIIDCLKGNLTYASLDRSPILIHKCIDFLPQFVAHEFFCQQGQRYHSLERLMENRTVNFVVPRLFTIANGWQKIAINKRIKECLPRLQDTPAFVKRIKRILKLYEEEIAKDRQPEIYICAYCGNDGQPMDKSKIIAHVDEIDAFLMSQSGTIRRERDKILCRHSEKGSCIYCAPLEPYDENYLKENGIKHLSFHSYLKKLTGVDKGKLAALEDINVRIKESCTSHLPWPKGICSCQPTAVTLNRQTYRHVDNVMFENPHIVERFLSYWRITGLQRCGYLYGAYEQDTDVPLGIRARVVAIYEPPQESTSFSITFHPDNEDAVNKIAKGLGLKKLGWIFTDLLPEDKAKGTVRHLRGIHSFFLSAQECVMAAELQNLHPNVCTLADGSKFGSKFATVLVTGDENRQVHMVGYQVSNQGMALVRDNCLIPTQKETPEFGWIRESTESQYVPDVFFKEKDEYGNEVPRISRPLPVEYLLVDVPVSTPKEPIFSLTALNQEIRPFPIENRFLEGHIQDFPSLGNYLAQFPSETNFLKKASDFHFLLYLGTIDLYDLYRHVDTLTEAIHKRDEEKAKVWESKEQWKSVKHLLFMIDESPKIKFLGLGSVSTVGEQSHWICSNCNFFNVASSNLCEVCNLPK